MSEIVLADSRGNVMERSEYEATLINPRTWLLESWNGAPSSSGVRIDRDVAMMVSPFWKAVMLIATDIAKCPLQIMQHTSRGCEVAKKHKSFEVMTVRANRFERSFDVIKRMVMHYLIYGGAYALLQFDEEGNVEEVLPLLPDMTLRMTIDGELYYDTVLYFGNGNWQRVLLDQSQVLDLTLYSHDGIIPRGTLHKAREVIGLYLALQRYGTTFFKNSARPSTVIKSPKSLDQKGREALRQGWEKMYQGLENGHKTAVLDEGMELQLISMSARDAQMIEQEQAVIREIANFFIMPASKLNEVSRNGYNSLEQDNLAYRSDCLTGHMRNVLCACNDKILSRKDRDAGFFYDFDDSVLDVATVADRATALSKALGNNAAWLTPNEARRREKENPIEGGDKLPENANQEHEEEETPAAAKAEGDDTEGQQEEMEENAAALVAVLRESVNEAIQRAHTRILNEAKKEFKRGGVQSALNALASAESVCNEVAARSVKALGLARSSDVTIIRTYTERVAVAGIQSVGGPPEEFIERLEKQANTILEDLKNAA